MAYFLVSVSTRENLLLCQEHLLAGFTNSINGLWTFLDIQEGDFLSFLYGARVHNLYRVIRKMALEDAEHLPPWPPVTFASGRTYYFPFRLILRQERELNEPMVRPEFAYVAENLLLRGGYRRTHFQADTVTFYQVSCMGTPSYREHIPTADLSSGKTFVPFLSFCSSKDNPSCYDPPKRYPLRELILQALLRQHLAHPPNLEPLLRSFGIAASADQFEVLGEKALPEGFVDLVIKAKHPQGRNHLILIEVKTQRASSADIEQLARYVDLLGDDCVGGLLIARDFPRRRRATLPKPLQDKIRFVRYSFQPVPKEENALTFDDLLTRLRLTMPSLQP